VTEDQDVTNGLSGTPVITFPHVAGIGNTNNLQITFRDQGFDVLLQAQEFLSIDTANDKGKNGSDVCSGTCDSGISGCRRA
jgi:hypothetical protein